MPFGRRAGVKVSGALRVRVWSVDHGHIPIDFAVNAVTPATASESSLARGLTLSALDGADLGAAMITLDQPGVLQLASGGDTVQWASGGDTVAARDSSGSMVAMPIPPDDFSIFDISRAGTGSCNAEF